MSIKTRSRLAAMALSTAVALATVGCPVGPPTGDTIYDVGFAAGFAQDDWYWEGFYDSYDTVDFGPIYYEGDQIAVVETPEYEAGYWDGVWWAYNDGYFVSYHYAFAVGFSEGYDNAFWPDYLGFLDGDEHVEYADGGWSDGYNDGYSEGRMFGASDFESDWDPDWLDALLDYEDGTDIYFEEIDLGTGIYGPVILYEYGTNPAAAKAAVQSERRGNLAPRSIRRSLLKATEPAGSLYRPLRSDVRTVLNVKEPSSSRSDRELRLETTWLERVDEYTATQARKSGTVRTRSIHLLIRESVL